MGQPQENSLEDLLDLFPTEDFSDMMGGITFNMIQEVVGDVGSLFETPAIQNEQPDLNVGCTASELTTIMHNIDLDQWVTHDVDLLNQGAPDDGAAAPDVIPDVIPEPQQAIGCENGLMYQTYLMLFGVLAQAMSVIQQPTANKRLRYACDGRRFLPDSRYHPMTIQLPSMDQFRFTDDVTLGVVMTIVTSTNNPMGQTFVHANDLSCEEPGVVKLGYGSVFVPLRQDETRKSFRRVSILYKKYEEYTFDLIPFDPQTMFGPAEKYTVPGQPTMENVPKGKRFKSEFDLSTYKFVFHLAVKQDNVVFISNIICETNEINEYVEPTRKRSVSAVSNAVAQENDDDDDDGDDDQSHESQPENPAKRFRATTLFEDGLPITRTSEGSDAPHRAANKRA